MIEVWSRHSQYLKSPTVMRFIFSLISSFFLTILASAQVVPSAQQQHLLDLTNQARAEQGIPPLTWDPALAAAALAHAQRMVDYRALSHQFPDEPDLATRAGQAGAHFRTVAENIAMAGSIDDLQREWMKSPPHRANILNSGLNHVGIGMLQQSGYWYAAVVFDTAVASLGSGQIEQRIAGLLQQEGMGGFRSPEAARRDCAVEDGDVSGTRPRFIMRWESSSLDHLPGQLEQRLQSGKYTVASVGACSGSGQGNQGFTAYRIAVLLY
jgi:uncharacterized protein YkwD